MANSLRAKLSKLRHDRHITEEEYQEFIKKLDGHDAKVRADAIDEVATRILMKANYFNIDTEDIEEFNENVEKVVYSVVDEMKEQKNE